MALAEKLGLEPGMRWDVIGPPADYEEQLGPMLPMLRRIPRQEAGLHAVHFYQRQRPELRRIMAQLRRQILPKGMIWVSWPHPASKEPTDITEAVVRNVGETMGLAIVEVIELDGRWMAAKLHRRGEHEAPD